MRQHLRGVQDAIERWNPEDHPVERPAGAHGVAVFTEPRR
jgi:hypothetical protein